MGFSVDGNHQTAHKQKGEGKEGLYDGLYEGLPGPKEQKGDAGPQGPKGDQNTQLTVMWCGKPVKCGILYSNTNKVC